MSVVTGLIKLFFGTKSEKDRKAIQPYVDKIKAIYPSIEQLTVDELRARSAGLKAAIAEYISAEEQQIAELKVQLENLDTSLDDKERISKQIDTLTEEIDRKIEEKLDEIMPEAFSIMKETARRQGFHPDRRRQGRLQQFVGSRREQARVGYGALRLPAFRRRRAA